ncbi:MAG: hypothetical protein HQK53_05855 [Oligoflexia bacterium]|nr:hypothetical protein [Oligoflexia bacterium]
MNLRVSARPGHRDPIDGPLGSHRKISPFAGRPTEESMLVNLLKLITSYYSEVVPYFWPKEVK